MPSTILAIDVGNSRIKFGLFADAAAASSGALPGCRGSKVVPIDAPIPWHELRTWAAAGGNASIQGAIAGANPGGVQKLLDGWPADWPRPTVIDRPDSLPIRLEVDAPERVGIDRVLNAVAANVLRPAGRPAIIVDSGTATTVDYVTAAGAFAGGAILPGFDLCARALHHYTALLPLLSIEELANEPHDPLGTDTRAALRSGLFWGQLGAVNELVRRLCALEPSEAGGTAETDVRNGSQEPLLLLTGGGAALLAPYLPAARWERQLSLQGVALVAAGESGGE
jgi:type III pantothenate kinase